MWDNVRTWWEKSCQNVQVDMYNACFDNTAINVLRKLRKYSTKVWRKNYNFFLKQFFSWKWSFGHVEWSFDKHARCFCQNSEKFFTLWPRLQMFEFFPIRNFLKKILFGQLQFTFEDHVEKLSEETGKTSTWYPELDYYFFSKGSFFLEKFPLARREQSWQPSRNFHIKSPEKFRRVFQNEKKTCISKTFFSWKVPLDPKNKVQITVVGKLEKFPHKKWNTTWNVFLQRKGFPNKTTLWTRSVQFWLRC